MKNIKVSIKADTRSLSKRNLMVLKQLKKLMPLVDKIYKMQVRGKGEYYPKGLSKKFFETYLKKNPKEKKTLEDHNNVVRKSGSKLTTIKYSELFKNELEKIVDGLLKASNNVTNKNLKKYLKLRARSFQNNDFATSDIFWLNLKNHPIEITIGPYEEYNDTLWGMKRSFEAVLGVCIKSENKRLHKFQKWALEFDRELGKKYKYKSNGITRTMLIMDEVSTGGFAHLGFVPMAYNLPNDTWIRQKYGTKQVFMRNVIYTKFNNITKRLAKLVTSKKVWSKFNADDFLLSIVGHEIAHGFGVYCKDGLRELGNGLEESKADVYGVLFLYWLADKGHISQKQAYAAALSKTIDGLRQIRLGQEEAHAQGAIIQYRWMMSTGGLKIVNGLIVPNEKMLRIGQESLGEKFAEIAFSKDYNKAKRFIKTWGKKIQEFEPLIKKLKNVPLDIDSVYN